MASSLTATKITTKRGSHDGSAVEKVPIYHFLMTPVIFVSFLLSLAWVDFRYSVLRSQKNSAESRLPAWLHHVIYRPAPDEGAVHGKGGRSTGGTRHGYYHSKQKKLAKMEMADAFEIRGTVVVILFAISMVMSWGLWTVGRGAWGWAKLKAY